MTLRGPVIQMSLSLALFLFLCGFGPDHADQIGADFILTYFARDASRVLG